MDSSQVYRSEQPVHNHIGYAVRYGRESDSERTTVLVPGSSTAFTVSNLEPGTRYSIAVAAVNSNGDMGEFSDRVVETTNGTRVIIIHAYIEPYYIMQMRVRAVVLLLHQLCWVLVCSCLSCSTLLL